MLPLIPAIAKLAKSSDYWELRGQVLILCSNALIYFNAIEEPESPMGDAIMETSQEHSPSKMSEGPKKRVADDVVSFYTPILFEMIEHAFTVSAPKATIKIGLIYLAKILNFYPEFTDTYLQVLLAAPDNIRSAVLEVDPLPGTEEEVYVSGPNTEKYRTFGAPHEWNSLYLAQAFERYVLANNLENLEWAHIQIFFACMHQDFKDDELDQWLALFASLKNYFFISLCYREFSMTSIDILKRFFCHESLVSTVMKECLEIFIKTLQLLYQPDCDIDCKQNVREFLEFLHDFEGDRALKEFVYNAIKHFAEQNKRAYQGSNLIDLMNKVVEHRRGDIFDDAASQTSLVDEKSSKGSTSKISPKKGVK